MPILERANRHYTTTLRREIRKVDPDFDRASMYSPEYEFSNGRVFEGKVNERGPYTPDD